MMPNNTISYDELLDLSFNSVLPSIEKELGIAITKTEKGTKSKNDVHYYIHCEAINLVIGVQVKINASPDVDDVGRLFNDDCSTEDLAMAMQSKGYQLAVVNIGVTSTDPVRFARRIFLKNDNFRFNYKKMNFIDANIYSNTFITISPLQNDDEWKTIAGFEDYKKPKAPYHSPYMVAKRPADENIKKAENRKAWECEDGATQKIYRMIEGGYVQSTNLQELTLLIQMIAQLTSNDIGVGDAFYYTCNAIDFIQGRFLSDSTPLNARETLVELKRLIKNNLFMKEYDFSLWKTTAINYMIYLFCFDKPAFTECVDAYRSENKPCDSFCDFIAQKMKSAFLTDPALFGYGQNVIDEITRLENINSPQNLEKYASMKGAIEEGMKEFDEIHKRLMKRSTRKKLGEAEEEILDKLTNEIYDFSKFTKGAFDDNLEYKYKCQIKSFAKTIDTYRKCLAHDGYILNQLLSGDYNVFERFLDVRDSKREYEAFKNSIK